MTEIRVELQLADGSFTSGMLRAGQTLAQFNQQLVRANPQLAGLAANNQNLVNSITRLDGANKGFVETLRDLSIVTGIISVGVGAASGAMKGWLGEILKVNSEMQRLQQQMRGMARSSDPAKEAAENVRYLREMAMSTPFSIDALGKSFVKLQSTGIDPMAGSLQSLADAIAGFGGSDEQFERATVAITQMSGKGVIQMEELRQQLGEHMPRAVELMARSMGVGIAELLEEIGKGTVKAKPALEALQAEWNRVYSGAAQRQMQTYAGELKRTTTLWSNLIQTIGGFDAESGQYDRNGFFATVTQQIKDLNQVLASTSANGFASEIGAGLTSVTHLIRDTVSALFQFRREIITVATVAATAFAFRAGIAGIGSLISTFGTLRNELKIVRIEMLASASWLATGATGLRSLQTAGIGASMMLTGLGMGIKAVGTAITVALPWVTAIGLALYTAAQYFDWFGDRVRNSYKDLEEFGAESRQQALETSEAYIEQLEKRLEGIKWNNYLLPGNKMLPGMIADMEKALAEARAKQKGLIDAAGSREDKKAASDLQASIDDRMSATQRAYDNEAVLIQQDIDARKQNVKDQVGIEKERRERLFAERTKQLEQNKDYLEQLAAQNKDALSAAAGDEALTSKLQSERGVINAELLEVMDLRRQLQQQGADGIGIEHLVNPDGASGKIEDATGDLADLRAEIREIQLQLRGASGAMAELETAIENGDYGSLEEGGEEALKLQQQLRAATRQKEALDRLMEGRSDAEKDAENARRKALEAQVDLLVERKELELGRKLTQGEVNNMKLDAGLYAGLGSEDKINGFLDGITSEFGNIELSAGTAADAIQDDAFGEATITNIQRANNELARFNANLGATSALGNDFRLGGFAASMSGSDAFAPVLQDLPEALADRMAVAMERLMQHGWSRDQAAGIVGNLSGESGLNPSARNKGDGANGSDSIGIAQWNEERAVALKQFAAQQGKDWNDFLVQLDFINHELLTSEATAGARLRLAGSTGQAANTFMRDYERPDAAQIAATGGTRAGYAAQAYSLVDEQKVNDLLAQRTQTVDGLRQVTLELAESNDTTTVIELENQRNEKLLERDRLLKDINDEIGNTTLEAAEAGDALSRVFEAIQAGEVGDSRDVKAAEYAELIKKATELDKISEEIAKKQDLQTDITGEAKRIEESRVEINQRLVDLKKQAADPNYKPESDTIRALEADMNAYIAKMRQLHGEDHRLTQDAVMQKQLMLRTARMADATEEANALQAETREVNLSLMTQRQQRQAAFKQRLAEIDAMAARWRSAGMDEVEVTRRTEEAKAAVRSQYASTMSPFVSQMQQWSDLQGNIAEQSTQWMDSLADGIGDLVTGSNSLKDVIAGIGKDMARMAVKWAFSSMVGGVLRGAKGGSKGVGVAHTGGIVGSSMLSTRRASVEAFVGAPKFHTGGIVGPALNPSETPIIAKNGEGIFTEDQMKSLAPVGSGTAIEINAPVTVNGSAGTPEQNADLAKRVARELKNTMSGTVTAEIRRQMRPGNMLNTKG